MKTKKLNIILIIVFCLFVNLSLVNAEELTPCKMTSENKLIDLECQDEWLSPDEIEQYFGQELADLARENKANWNMGKSRGAKSTNDEHSIIGTLTDSLDYVEKNLETGELSGFNIDEFALQQKKANNEISEASSNGSLPSPRIVIGSDDRSLVSNTTASPYRMIGKTLSIFPNGDGYVATAWMGSRQTAFTNSHVVYNPESGGFVSQMIFIPALNGETQPYGGYAVTNATATSQYIDAADQGSGYVEYDFASITLSSAVGDQTGYFGLYPSSGSGTNVRITGYPAQRYDGLHQYTMAGPLTLANTQRIEYKIDTEGGQSGSPVYLESSNQVVGMHSSGYSASQINAGPKMGNAFYWFVMKYR